MALYTGPEANHNAAFAREVLSGSGPAFEQLFNRLWQPGMDLAAALITQASGGRHAGNAARVRAIIMISSLIGFSTGREVITRAIGPDPLGDTVRAELLAVVDEQIELIARSRP